MLLKELKLISEGAVADKYEELKDEAQKCATYIFVNARPAMNDDLETRLHTVGVPTIGHKKQVEKGDYIARVHMTGSVENPSPMKHLFVIPEKSFTQFTQLKHSKPDIEGFIAYEAEGDECEFVKDGSRYIVKNGKDLTQMPASLFNKQFRIKGE